MKIKIKATLLALAVGSLLAATSSQAANPNYAPGDLILGFQATGGTGSDKSILVNLGNTATVFRDGGDFSSIINIASILESTFGVGWQERSDISFGLIGVWGNASLGNGLQNGDPLRTIYASRARTTIGTAGIANSIPFSGLGDTAMSSTSNQIVGLQNYFENTFTTNIAVVNNADTPSDWAQLVPTGGASFGGLTGGIQTSFGNGVIGSYEGLLDLYRLQAKNDVAGQYGFGQPIQGPGEYLGSLGIDTNGNVSWVTAVPEPSTYVLVGAGAVLIGLLRRANRRAKA